MVWATKCGPNDANLFQQQQHWHEDGMGRGRGGEWNDNPERYRVRLYSIRILSCYHCYQFPIKTRRGTEWGTISTVIILVRVVSECMIIAASLDGSRRTFSLFRLPSVMSIVLGKLQKNRGFRKKSIENRWILLPVSGVIGITDFPTFFLCFTPFLYFRITRCITEAVWWTWRTMRRDTE